MIEGWKANLRQTPLIQQLIAEDSRAAITRVSMELKQLLDDKDGQILALATELESARAGTTPQSPPAHPGQAGGDNALPQDTSRPPPWARAIIADEVRAALQEMAVQPQPVAVASPVPYYPSVPTRPSLPATGGGFPFRSYLK